MSDLNDFISTLYQPENFGDESVKLAKELEGLSLEQLADLAGYPELADDLHAKTAGLSMVKSCGGGYDSSWLTQFEGSPLYEAAIQLCEQELEMKAQQLQERVARQKSFDHEEEWNQRDQMDLQKQRLELALHKHKAGKPAIPDQGAMPQPEPQPQPDGAALQTKEANAMAAAGRLVGSAGRSGKGMFARLKGALKNRSATGRLQQAAQQTKRVAPTTASSSARQAQDATKSRARAILAGHSGKGRAGNTLKAMHRNQTGTRTLGSGVTGAAASRNRAMTKTMQEEAVQQMQEAIKLAVSGRWVAQKATDGIQKRLRSGNKLPISSGKTRSKVQTEMSKIDKTVEDLGGGTKARAGMRRRYLDRLKKQTDAS